MGSVVLNGATSGSTTLTPTDAVTVNLTLPSSSGTLATTAGSVSTATNIAGGSAGVVPYQTGSGATSFTSVGTTGQVLTSNGSSAPTWANVSASPAGSSGAIQYNNGGSFGAAGNISNSTTIGFKNRIINGAMAIDQRNAGASVSNTSTTFYGLDRWILAGVSGCTFTGQQVSDAPTGFTYSNKITITSTTTANDYGYVGQRFEANNVSDLNWGTSNTQTITISFWAKANNAGTYNSQVRFFGSTAFYYYTHAYTLTANTWTYISYTVTGAPTGSGAYTGANNGEYMEVSPLNIISSGYTGTTTADTWSSTNAWKTSGAFTIASTASATFQFTGVQLEVGSQATSFDYRSISTELGLCYRYYYSRYHSSTNSGNTQAYPGAVCASAPGTGGFSASQSFPTVMRATPSFTFSQAGNVGKIWNVDTAGAISYTLTQNWWDTFGIQGLPSSSGATTTNTTYGFDFAVSAEL